MAKIEKIKEKLIDEEYIESITQKYLENKEVITLSFIKKGTPENYVRERYTSRGGRFYNKKGGLMKKDHEFYAKQIPTLLRKRLSELVVNKTADYYVSLDIDFYVPIQKAESIKRSVLKEKKIIRPAIRPDLDNYLKYSLDVLHNIIFDDDSRVVTVNSNKYYSVTPRTEIFVTIIILND